MSKRTAAAVPMFAALLEHMGSQLEGEDGRAPTLEAFSIEDSNAICLGRHESEQKGSQASWEGSAHARRGLKCTECHAEGLRSFRRVNVSRRSVVGA
jgi:hypothetical protein